jgi:hypothetical protein
MTPRRPTPRRLASLLAAGLLATLLPLLAGVPAAQAAGCQDETRSGNALLGFSGCDDITPPDTTITAVAPAPTALGYTRSTTVAFAWTGSYAEPDTGELTYQCQLFSTATPPEQWQSCTSPKVYEGLADSSAAPYTFRVRAVDSDDAAIAACDGNPEPLTDPFCTNEESVADVDPTPATTTVRVDTVAPNTFLDSEPVDSIRPDKPVVTTASPTLQLNSNEPAGFACTLNGAAVKACAKGVVTLADLKGGSYTFVARAFDAALNIDPTPVTTTFFVPTNIKKSKRSGWSKVRQAGLFGNDYLTASKVGRNLVLPAVKNVREVRLLAPTGPTLGKVEVRIGTSQWYTVDLFSKKPRALVQLLVRDEFTLPRSGPIQIRVKQLTGKRTSVRVDAIVARAG